MTTWVVTALVWLLLAPALELGMGMALLGATLALLFGAIASRLPDRPAAHEEASEVEETAEDLLLLDDEL